eukprot:9326232-Prorocentrum_lima.AAC.1
MFKDHIEVDNIPKWRDGSLSASVVAVPPYEPGRKDPWQHMTDICTRYTRLALPLTEQPNQLFRVSAR